MSQSTTQITLMKASGVQHLIERAYRESSDLQYIRELVVNAIEAGAKTIEIGPEWGAVETDGVYRFMIADDGRGMDPDELMKYLNTFGGGGKPIGDAHENFGVGSKTSTLPWNQEGVVTISWTEAHPEGHMVWLMRDAKTGEYGAVKFATDDGYHEVVRPHGAFANIRPAFVKSHGTVVVLLGSTGKEDTFLGKDGAGDIKGITAYLNKRLWRISADVTITVQELRSQKRAEWPRSLAEASGPAPKNDTDADRRWNRREVEGAEHFVIYPKKDAKGRLAGHGSVKLADGTFIDWYLWSGDRPGVHSYAHKNGFLAALYRNELYDTQSHVAHYRAFGITQRTVRENLTLVARPPHTDGTFGVYPDTARNALKIQGNKRAGEKLPWAEWGEEFASQMPDAIRDALAKATTLNASGTLDEKWRQRLEDRFASRWKTTRLLLVETGTPVAPGAAQGISGRGNGGGGGGGGGGGNEPGPIGPESGPARYGTLTGRKTAQAVTVPTSGGVPDFQWDAGGVEDGCAAAWVKSAPGHPNGVVLLNPSFGAFLEVRKYWKEQYPHHMEKEIDAVVSQVYGEAMVARIAHSQELVRHPLWGQDKVDTELRSPQALTMAALGLISEDQIIGSRLAGLLGARSKKSA